MALLLNLGVLKKLSAGFGGNFPPLATALDIVLPLPFVLLRSEINKFISFVLHRKMCITELYKQFNRSLIIFLVHRNCLSLRFSVFFFLLFFSCFDCDFPCLHEDKISRSTMRHAVFVLHVLVNLQ